MKNLQTLANELAANKMTLLVNDDLLNIKGGFFFKFGYAKKQSFKVKSRKKKSNKGYGGGYGGGVGNGYGGGHGNGNGCGCGGH
jgi:hypothetical protein